VQATGIDGESSSCRHWQPDGRSSYGSYGHRGEGAAAAALATDSGSLIAGTPTRVDQDPDLGEVPAVVKPGSQEGAAVATSPLVNIREVEGAAADRPEAAAATKLPAEAATASTKPPNVPLKKTLLCALFTQYVIPTFFSPFNQY
jgi:hypothetical protein